MDCWIELVDRRFEEKAKKTSQAAQVKEEKAEAAVRRENLMKTFSQKRSYQEVVEAIDDTTEPETMTVREKRRKIGEGRVKGKEREIIDELKEHDNKSFIQMKDLMKEIFSQMNTPTVTPAITPSVTPASTIATPAVTPAITPVITGAPFSSAPGPEGHTITSRLDNVEQAIHEVRATHQDIIRFMHELRGNFSQGWRQE